ncbi:MAG TPA: lysophospholipid acyltransferase family protein [Rhodocyclaceae bacterium]|nr:lysophospholipid acyltransferase family protein [Rhodocyclaceae bacterium]
MNMISFKAVARFFLVALHLLYGVFLASLIFPLCAKPTRGKIGQTWCRQMLWALDIHLSLEDGASFAGSGLLICNHISFIDIFVINAYTPTVFVAKSEVATWPLIGRLATRADTVFIERGRPKAAFLTSAAIRQRLSSGQSVSFFPEGTTSLGETVKPFHAALFQSAIDADAPIHCLALCYLTRQGYLSTAPAYIENISLMQCLWQVLTSGGLQAHLQTLPSVSSSNIDRRHLAHSTHTRIVHALADYRSRIPRAN